MPILEHITGPQDVKSLSRDELLSLTEEIRQRVIQVTATNGGHIGPNLGVVEMTVALHKVFNTPEDHFTFDVSHQGYVHKLLTGRNNEQFDNIRLTGGLSGFLNRQESPHDSFGAGHAGTALSAALGMAAARDLRGGNEHVVAVLGDAAFTCGITMEALNNVASSTKKLIIILNDNEWSIDKNVGAISTYLNELITNPIYNRVHQDLGQILQQLPGGKSLLKIGSRAKKEAKDFVVHESSLFEKFDIRYLGPIDGHNLDDLIKYLQFCKDFPEPILLHIKTQKGKGYQAAIDNPEKFHGTSPFEVETGKSIGSAKPSPPKYQDVFGKALLRFAQEDANIVGITGAMPSGTGLSYLQATLPDQYFDVGIAEEHAVLFAAGLATKGIHPVVAIYSTFLQRGYDPIIHDVCLQNLPVLFCMDRAGLSPNDGATHHGLFDIAYLRCVPGTVIMQPKDEDELIDMMWTGLSYPGPAFVRYPRGNAQGVPVKETPTLLEIGKAELVQAGQQVALWALGEMLFTAQDIAQKLQEHYDIRATVVNARFVKPLDDTLLHQQAQQHDLIISLEDGTCVGGLGSAIIESLQQQNLSTPVEVVGWPDQFVEHGSSVAILRQENGLDLASIWSRIEARIQQISPAWCHYSTSNTTNE